MTTVLMTSTVACHDCKDEFSVQRASITQCPRRCPECHRERKAAQRKGSLRPPDEDIREPSEECKEVLREIRAYVAHGYALLHGLRASCNAWAREHELPEYRPAPLWSES